MDHELTRISHSGYLIAPYYPSTIAQKVTLKFHIRKCGVSDRVAPADRGCGPERFVRHRAERTVEGRVQWARAGDNEKSKRSHSC